MNVRHYPDQETVERAVRNDDPLLVLVAHDETELLAANIDDSLEHYVLLKQLGHSEAEIDKYFRVVLSHSGADWTFVCPSDYKGIGDRAKRIEKYYSDGIDILSRALRRIGYDVDIDIPRRYRRHLDALSE
jgi:hypothetical protein